MKTSEWFWECFHVFVSLFWLGYFLFAILSDNEALNWHKACTISAFWAAYASIGWLNAKADKRGDEE